MYDCACHVSFSYVILKEMVLQCIILSTMLQKNKTKQKKKNEFKILWYMWKSGDEILSYFPIEIVHYIEELLYFRLDLNTIE